MSSQSAEFEIWAISEDGDETEKTVADVSLTDVPGRVRLQAACKVTRSGVYTHYRIKWLGMSRVAPMETIKQKLSPGDYMWVYVTMDFTGFYTVLKPLELNEGWNV